MKKREVTITVDEEIIRWIEKQIARKRFASISRAVEYAVTRLMESDEVNQPSSSSAFTNFKKVFIPRSVHLYTYRCHLTE